MIYLYIFLAIVKAILVIYGLCLATYAIMQPRYAGTYTWRIKAGHHYCSLWQRIVFWMFWVGGWKFTARSMEYTIVFNKSMEYVFTDGNQDDISKLPGFQKWFDKTNRTLRGWCWNPRLKRFECYEYYHKDSPKPTYKYIGFCASGYSYKFNVPNPFPFSTPLFPYFGGDEVAPHDMDITITGMVVK